jgi:hypothetical protein
MLMSSAHEDLQESRVVSVIDLMKMKEDLEREKTARRDTQLELASIEKLQSDSESKSLETIKNANSKLMDVEAELANAKLECSESEKKLKVSISYQAKIASTDNINRISVKDRSG